MAAQKIILFNNPTARQHEIAIDTIILDRELNIPSLLPVAFWLTTTWIESLATKPAMSLSEADRNTMGRSSRPLRNAHAQYLFGWLDEASTNPECPQPAKCTEQKMVYLIKPFGSRLGQARPSAGGRLRWEVYVHHVLPWLAARILQARSAYGTNFPLSFVYPRGTSYWQPTPANKVAFQSLCLSFTYQP
jgi:hypothetical protein